MSKLLANDTYQQEYNKDFVSHWDDLIGWEGRAAAEEGFFQRVLRTYDCKNVIDVACGTGFHSVMLAQAGLDVTASDGAANMIDKTRANADEHGVKMADYGVCDWVDLKSHYGENTFDALVCLGNAFTHLFDHETRRDCLENMLAVLKPGGLAVIDHRNYDAILDQGYNNKGRYYYTGEAVDARPIEITRTLCKFQYSFPSGQTHFLSMYPIKQNYMSHLLEDAGFVDVTRYGDFTRPYAHYEPDFIQQMAFKPKG